MVFVHAGSWRLCWLHGPEEPWHTFPSEEKEVESLTYLLDTQFNTLTCSEAKLIFFLNFHNISRGLLSHPYQIVSKVSDFSLSFVVSKPSVKLQQSQHPKRNERGSLRRRCACINVYVRMKSRTREGGRKKHVEPGLCSSPAHYIQLDSTAHPRNASPLNWHTIAHTHTSVACSSYLASNTSFAAAASHCIRHNHMWGRCFYSPTHKNIIGPRLAPDQAPCWHGDRSTQWVYREQSRRGNPPLTSLKLMNGRN